MDDRLNMITPMHVQEGWRIFLRARKARKAGFKQYDGPPEEICMRIIEDAYDHERRYFRVSCGHFCEFYIRDFAFCCEALVELGFAKEVHNTLVYALDKYGAAKKVTTSISPSGVAFDFPSYGPDSLAMLLYAITHTHNEELAKKYHLFLQDQVDYFVQHVIDRRTLLPLRGNFSSIRDHAQRKSSCYDAVMIAVVARETKRLGLRFLYTEQQIVDAIISHYWNGTYFFEDIHKHPIIVGDANVFPLWTGIITDKTITENVMAAIQAAGLDKPFPLRYVSHLDKDREKISLHIANLFASDYETTSIWIHMGLCYMRIAAEHDPLLARKYLDKYTANIKKYKTFLEVYDSKGDPFTTGFYMTDEAMLWCANYLVLAKKFEKEK